MATREKIEFDFRQAMSQADKIDGLADDLKRLAADKFDGSLQNLAASWKGENASLYLEKGSSLQNKMNKTSGELHAAAEAVRKIARRLYDAEMAALEIASVRTY